MQFKTRSFFALVALAAAACGAQAQSSIQCTVGPNGLLEAALVWRNTLGADRANAMCRAGAPATPVAFGSEAASNRYVAMNAPVLSSPAYQPTYSPRPPVQDEEFVPLVYR
jgi:hypothetical protein